MYVPHWEWIMANFFRQIVFFRLFSVEEEEEADEELETKAPAVCDDSGVLHRASSRSSLASEASAQNLDLALVQGLTPFSKPLMATSSDPEATPAPFPGKNCEIDFTKFFFLEFKFTENSLMNNDNDLCFSCITNWHGSQSSGISA